MQPTDQEGTPRGIDQPHLADVRGVPAGIDEFGQRRLRQPVTAAVQPRPGGA